MGVIDIRSDTVTHPTREMRDAMAEAEVGDDVYGDDPTVNRLEKLAASVMGKEAALFVSSGTQGNQISVMTHIERGDEIIAGVQSHIIHYEAGAAARLSGAAYALADNPDHVVYAADVRRLARPGDIHFPRTALLCLENALCDGTVVPLAAMKASAGAAWELGFKVHLDGARIFNAALTLGIEAREIAACADSVMFCVSKGLCAPVGSLLCGTREFVDRARRNRKVMGGAMRQAGILAAAGIIAIEKMTKRLGEDHENAKYLGKKLAEIPGITVNEEKIQINMVFWETAVPGFNSEDFVAFLSKKNIKASGKPREGLYRMVTHNGVSRPDLDTVIEAVKEYASGVSLRR
ncbi:MAG: low-specificity L-threonine aldolase [Spirochaetaceae bacterium]|jgi:threonine aldolase|nr:low-specificity L-threonine aldolase [Spirochaetaceae bacterium]